MTESKKFEVVIGGKKTVYEPVMKDISKLKYYLQNPRVNYILSQYTTIPSQEQIQKELWKLDSTKDLYRDILENKGVIEPIIVKDNLVLEGNSRLCACRKLYEDAKDEKEKEHWKYIPGITLSSDIDEKQILQLLGVFHIRGKAPWRTFEKASYVHRMKNQFYISEEEIAKDIGITVADVEQMIESYATMKKEKVENIEKISYFIEFFKNRELKSIREKKPSIINEFSTWVKEDRIPRAEEVRNLPKILHDKEANKLFREGGMFEAAKDVAINRNPEYGSSFFKHLSKMTHDLRKAQIAKLLKEIKEELKLKIVRDFINEVKTFEKNLKL